LRWSNRDWLDEENLSAVQAMKPLSLWRRLLRMEDFARQFPPPTIDSESQARDVRAAFESLITNDVERFDRLFLQGEACAAQPAEQEYLDVLAKAGYLKKTIGTVFKPCVRVFVLDGHFIATDLLSHTDEDQVFSLMMEQALLVRAMDVRKGDHFLELCLGSGVNALSAASRAPDGQWASISAAEPRRLPNPTRWSICGRSAMKRNSK
jgi:hypothetical protein